MKRLLILLSITTFGILALPVQADHNSPRFSNHDRIQQRLENQYHRIRDGINSGELTRKEARRLRKHQRHIMRLMYHYMHDNYLDRYEFSELRNELDRASKRIYLLKHNDHSRYARHYYY